MNTIIRLTPLYAICGLLIAIIGFVVLKLSHTVERRCTQSATGYILDNKPVTDKNRTLYYPLVAYELDDINYTAQYRLGTKAVKYEPKQTVKIRVNPNDHFEIFIETEQSNTYERIAEILMGVGILVFVVSSLMTLI